MISLSRYAALLERPELRQTIVASVIGRLPIGILGLAILLATQASSGSFGFAGAVAASYLAGLAAMAPVLGRLIDRAGPRRLLAACAGVFPTALIALVAALRLDAPSWAWRAGDLIVQVHPVVVPESAARGEYAAAVGIYDRASGARLPVVGGAIRSKPRRWSFSRSTGFLTRVLPTVISRVKKPASQGSPAPLFPES